MESQAISVIIILIVAVIVVGAIWGGAIWRRNVTKHWPIVNARVEQTRVIHVRGRGLSFPRYYPAILYSYQVNGQFYSGESQLNRSSLDADDAMEMAQPWLHRKILVHYNPKNPDKSIYLGE
jgi:hypothetical protein